jgi:hypothetical protein
VVGGPVPPQGTIGVVQSVQSLDGDVPLIAGKPTMVRIYLDNKEYQGLKFTGQLEVKRVKTGEALTTESVNSIEILSGQDNTLMQEHDDLTKSLNFVLPVEWTASGEITLRLANVLRDPDKVKLPCPFCTVAPKPATFFAAPAQTAGRIPFGEGQVSSSLYAVFLPLPLALIGFGLVTRKPGPRGRQLWLLCSLFLAFVAL